jgi:autotransporter passenger strand-loop-strand repeat protein
MSDPTYQGAIYGLQGGSTTNVDSGGTLNILSGGSVRVASGGVLSIAAGGSFVNSGNQSLSGNVVVASGGTLSVASGGSQQVASGGNVNIAASPGFTAPLGITLGGTIGRWAFGTATLTSGIGTIATGMIRVHSANANTVLGQDPGLGTHTATIVDLSLSAAGSVIFRAAAGTLPFTANTVIAWQAFGT